MLKSTTIAMSSLLAFQIVVSGCTTSDKGLTESGYKLLSRDEIRATLAGNTLSGDQGRAVFVSADGQLRSSNSKQGRWTVTDENQWCDEWPNAPKATDCDHIYLRGNEVVFVNIDGSKSNKGTIVPGNSRGL